MSIWTLKNLTQNTIPITIPEGGEFTTVFLLPAEERDFPVLTADILRLYSPAFRFVDIVPAPVVGEPPAPSPGPSPAPGNAPELLTEDRTYYVRTTGSDSNDGLSWEESPFLTIQHAIDVACNLHSNGNWIVTIQIGDGTYAETLTVRHSLGFDNTYEFTPHLRIVGNTDSTVSVVFDGMYVLGGAVALFGVTLNYGIMPYNHSHVIVKGCRFGFIDCSDSYLRIENCSWVGSYFFGMRIWRGSTVEVNACGFEGPNSYADAIVVVAGLSSAYFHSGTGGMPEGRRYDVREGSIIQTYGGGPTYLAGDAPGTVADTAQYL